MCGYWPLLGRICWTWALLFLGCQRVQIGLLVYLTSIFTFTIEAYLIILSYPPNPNDI